MSTPPLVPVTDPADPLAQALFEIEATLDEQGWDSDRPSLWLLADHPDGIWAGHLEIPDRAWVATEGRPHRLLTHLATMGPPAGLVPFGFRAVALGLDSWAVAAPAGDPDVEAAVLARELDRHPNRYWVRHVLAASIGGRWAAVIRHGGAEPVLDPVVHKGNIPMALWRLTVSLGATVGATAN